jgi:hypothetical protein
MCHVDVGGHPLCSDSCPLVASLPDGASHEVEVFLLHICTVPDDRTVWTPKRLNPRGHRNPPSLLKFSDDSAEEDTRR